MGAIDKTLGGRGEPFSHLFPITPSDESEVRVVTRAIYVGGTGDISVMSDGAGGDVIGVLTAAQAGTVIPGRVRKVFATGTTATNLVGLY